MKQTSQSAHARELKVGSIGIWSVLPRYAPEGAGLAAAKDLEEMGFGTLWVPGGVDNGILASLDELMDATSSITLAAGVLNIWMHEPEEVAAWWNGQSPERQSRLVMGIGVSHGPLIGDAYKDVKPLAKMRAYVNALEAAGMPLGRVALGGLGPKMLELAATRTAGTHPYLVSPRHSAAAREIMGPDALIAPHQNVILESDAATARAWARGMLSAYLNLPNYMNNWLRDGFSQQEIDDVNDRLVDSLFAWGDLDAIAARIQEHFDAGADHVALHVTSANGLAAGIDEHMPIWRELAKLL
ncbi:TIGR03620 family F420-dependent LLM class oxidoreductase [Sphingobium tyrosinilyticum]|uniref:TIGR03620 family F420-dependent LLM class oxidoreductase n=1 Tax=Sphingobium tyrosinilyticum TaxID=2715436 RepID=A0ABV9F1M2_9SPHN